MKRTVFTKASALLIAGVVAASAGVSASAAGSDLTVEGTNIPLTKSIVFFNADGSAVYEPNITFTYAAAPVALTEGETTVSDGTDTVQVYSGVADGVSGTTIAFSANNDAVTTSAQGTKLDRSSDLSVDLSKFDHAGVYRYEITETPSAEVQTLGLDERTAEYTDTRYLDIYLKNGAAGLELYGAVIFKSADAQTDITAATDKTVGFDSASTDYENDNTVDKYTTYNIEVKKLVSGNLADKTHAFPFYVDLKNTISGAKYTYTEGGTAEAQTVAGTSVAKGSDSAASVLKLSDGQSVKFVGVPSSQTAALSIDVKEWNDTYDVYEASVTAANGTVTINGESEMAAKTASVTSSAAISTFDVKANDTAAQLITVTNTIKEISPTGLVLRFAPFAIMAGFGVLFLVLARRHNNKKKDDSDII